MGERPNTWLSRKINNCARKRRGFAFPCFFLMQEVTAQSMRFGVGCSPGFGRPQALKRGEHHRAHAHQSSTSCHVEVAKTNKKYRVVKLLDHQKQCLGVSEKTASHKMNEVILQRVRRCAILSKVCKNLSQGCGHGPPLTEAERAAIENPRPKVPGEEIRALHFGGRGQPHLKTLAKVNARAPPLKTLGRRDKGKDTKIE